MIVILVKFKIGQILCWTMLLAQTLGSSACYLFLIFIFNKFNFRIFGTYSSEFAITSLVIQRYFIFLLESFNVLAVLAARIFLKNLNSWQRQKIVTCISCYRGVQCRAGQGRRRRGEGAGNSLWKINFTSFSMLLILPVLNFHSGLSAGASLMCY